MGTARSRLIAPKLTQKYFSLTLLSSGKGQVTLLKLNQVLKVWVEFCALVFMFLHSMNSPRKLNKYQIIKLLNQTGYLLMGRWKVWSRQALQRGFPNHQSCSATSALLLQENGTEHNVGPHQETPLENPVLFRMSMMQI